jgi:hypothetical protein
MEKVDLRKAVPGYAGRVGRFDDLVIEPRRYLMVDGQGDPNTAPAFSAAVETLYPVAYTLKFAARERHGRDHVVPPLEGLWWADDMATFTAARDKNRWSWTLLLLVPDWIGGDEVTAAVDTVGDKKDPPPLLDELRCDVLDEGRCLQTLHVGSFDDEAPVLARLHDEEVPSRGLRMTGHHHEIYLSDMRRVAPERRRTILRQPVQAVGATGGTSDAVVPRT